MPDIPPQFVTARRAAELTGLNERTIRRMIHRGDLPATKIAVNRYLINVADLPPRRRNRTQEALEALRSDVDALRRRLNSLETARMPPDALRADSDGLAGLPLSSTVYTPYKPSGAAYSATFQPLPQPIARVSDAVAFLARHGVAQGTPKGWEWLKDELAVSSISGADLLIRTRDYLASRGHRTRGIVLHRCTQADCPCQTLL